ncbi:hypothetical protein DFH07DRAFT_737719 [Mycena maculata]|uniref:WD40 repeat-like protein n=1 Tax=Mycena maculata TaxID=230809 RepID=A0AAD7JIG4_9AGAR|nr:hypothetical protein DFH07DRAFT_737719 [Mycena maculata]
MAPAKRRVSYIIPPPNEPVPYLELPSQTAVRLGLVRPLLILSKHQPPPDLDQATRTRHPRHRLGVAALALDTSTQLSGHSAPEGILYSGGRDGLVLSWDLALPMRRRTPPDSAARRGRWEALTGWADDAIDEEGEEADERPTSDGDILGDVTAGAARRRHPSNGELPHEEQWEMDGEPTRASSFRQCVQTHTDWVNDILLCNYNQTLVSASSDGTVQAWSPHASGAPDPSIIGTHSDYVRCLAACRTQNWVASGSFDRTIKLWDLTRSATPGAPSPGPLISLNPADANAPKSSVYALAADPFGHAIASGGPERVVRMWDPRTGKRSGKLVGHTDNIRAILLSEDAKYLLTGSADASIKLWSLATQRCLHTFTHHADSVWALFSSHPTLATFYAGDRAGLVSRVDVAAVPAGGDVGDGECALVCRDEGPAAGQGGINRIVVADDSLVWTATSGSSVKRWRIPPRSVGGSGYGTSGSYGASTPNYGNARQSPGEGDGDYARSLAPSVISDDGDDGDEDETRHGLPYASLIRLTSPNDPFPVRGGARERDAEVATLYSAASVVSVPPLRVPLSPHQSHIASPLRSAPFYPRRAYLTRELATDAHPLVSVPDAIGTLTGERGLVRALVLNDRVHAVSVDTVGEISVWDIVRGVCVGVFTKEALEGGACGIERAGKEGWRPREALERVRERIEGEAVVASWATIDTKAGVLTVHINERSFESEIYADEVGFAGDRRFGEEAKFNIGKWVLRNLFLGFIREEQRTRRPRRDSTHSQDTTSSAHHRASLSSDTTHNRRPSLTNEQRRRGSATVVSAPKMVPAVPPVAAAGAPPGTSPLLTPLIPLYVRGKDAQHLAMPSIPQSPATPGNDATPMPQPQWRVRSGTLETGVGGKDREPTDYFSVRTRQVSIQGGVAPSAPDDFSGWGGPGAHTPSTPTGLMGRLKSFGKLKRAADIATPVLPTTVEARIIEEAVPEPAAKTPLQLLLAGPLTPPPSSEAPTLGLSFHISLLIEEEATPGFTTVYRGTVGSTATDVHVLEEAMPLWLVEFLLLHRMPSTPPQIKLSFVLLPWVGRDGEEQLPELLNTCYAIKTHCKSVAACSETRRAREAFPAGPAPRLTTSAQVQEKLERIDPPPTDAPRPRAEDLYEILCNDVVLPLDMSIAAVRQYVWRQSTELTMCYRRNREMAAYRGTRRE